MAGWIPFWLSGWGSTEYAPADDGGGIELGGDHSYAFESGLLTIPAISGAWMRTVHVQRDHRPPREKKKIPLPRTFEPVVDEGGVEFGGNVFEVFLEAPPPLEFVVRPHGGVSLGGDHSATFVQAYDPIMSLGGSHSYKFIPGNVIRTNRSRVSRQIIRVITQ
jgi:hypothetical protein